MSGQGTPEWFAARAGKATASRFKDVLATVKSGEAASRRDYRYQLAVERLTGTMVEGYSNAAMQWGTDTEPYAREAFEIATGLLVDEVGFVEHPDLLTGCSPDGLIDDDGLIEIKAPYNSAIHLQTIMDGMPSHHMPQVQGQMWITGRMWCDFVSFDPRMPESMRLYVERQHRDDEYIKTLDSQVRKFLDEVVNLEAKLREKLESMGRL